MINSMTGYGQAEGEVKGLLFAVEIKSVNNRYFKTAIKLPETVAFLEEDIEKLLRRSLSRGTVNYILRLKHVPAEACYDIDDAVLQQFVRKLGPVVSSADISLAVDLAGLLSLPGVLVPPSPDEQTAADIRQAVLAVSGQALDNLRQMRAAEGTALAADLDGHCQVIKHELEQIRGRNSTTLQEYQSRLKKRVDELLAAAELKLDEATLAREVAVFAERSDISEEIARLGHHLEQFMETCANVRSSESGAGSRANNQAAGRRLEFISQEMLREANTIASKAPNAEIIHYVVDIKCQIERIKEQVQNVE